MITYRISENFMKVEGENIFFYSLLNNISNKTLLFLHGAGANAESWMPVLMKLSDKVNAIAIDMPGHYRSAGKPKESIAEMAVFISSFVKEVKNQFSMTGEIVCVGHSLGGAVTIELGVRHEEWLRQMVLVTTSGRLDVVEPAILQKLKQGEMDTSFYRKGFSPTSSPKLLEAILKKLEFGSLEVTYSDFMAGFQFDRMQDLNKILAKTLIISGQDDIIVQPNAARLLYDGIPDSKWVDIEDMGHFCTLEQPETIAKEIENFIDAEITVGKSTRERQKTN